MKAEVYEHTWLAMDLPFLCEIHTYGPRPFTIPGAKKVLIICTEPRAGMISNEWVLENHEKYDLILAYDDRLKHLPNVKMQAFGGTWCEGFPSRKEFSYSFLYSTGAELNHYAGYDIRRNIARNFGNEAIPGRLFFSTKRLTISDEDRKDICERSSKKNYTVDNIYQSKLPALESMFHISVENHNDKGFFTEKIVDCFRSYCIPIYWGTDDIGDFFDLDGIIIMKNANSLQEILSQLTPEYYWSRMPAMAENYRRSHNYLDVVPHIRQALIETFAETRDQN